MLLSRLLPATLLVFGVALAAPSQAARIDFDGVVPAGDRVVPITPYSESGYTLSTSLPGTNTDGIFDPGVPFSLVHNGTALFGWCGGCVAQPVVLTLTRDGGGPFGLISLEASNLIAGALDLGEHIVVTGNLMGGGTVVQNLNLVQDVMTVFDLGPGFANLASVEFRGSLAPSGNHLAIDNLILSPEPGTGVLVCGGLIGLGLRGRRRRRRSA